MLCPTNQKNHNIVYKYAGLLPCKLVVWHSILFLHENEVKID